MNFIEWEITRNYRNLRPSERKVADFLLHCEKDLSDITLVELATSAEVSQPTVLRFARSMGYHGFKELKNAILEEKIRKKIDKEIIDPLYGFPIDKEDILTDVPSKVIGTTLHVLKETIKSISLKEFVKAIELITKSESIFVFGVENSLCAVSDLVTKFLYLGLKCDKYDDYYIQNIQANSLQQGDVAIGISYSGRSRNTVEVIRASKKSGANTIVITNFEDAPITKYADVVICTSNEQFLYGNAIFSRSSQLAIVDMLYMGVLISDYDKYTSNLDSNAKSISNNIYEIE